MDKKLKKELKASAHHLKPVVMIGDKGLTEAVQLEVERALITHELIKIKINYGEREDRKKIIGDICESHKAEFIQAIGKVVVIYRKNEDEDNS